MYKAWFRWAELEAEQPDRRLLQQPPGHRVRTCSKACCSPGVVISICSHRFGGNSPRTASPAHTEVLGSNQCLGVSSKTLGTPACLVLDACDGGENSISQGMVPADYALSPLPHPGHCSCTKWRTAITSHFESSSWRQVILPQTVFCQNTENSCYSHTLEPPAHFKTLQGEDLAHKFFSCKSCYFWSSCCVKETNPWFTQFARNRKKRDNTNTDKSNREKNSQEENCLTLIYNVSCVCVSVCLISAKCSWGS